MDTIKAEQLYRQVKGTKIKDIYIEELIDNGKSAAVYRGRKDNTLYAIKIFDTELIEKFGNEIQQERINLELSLKEHKINNLVKILEGGETYIDNKKYYYIIMEYIKGMNLRKYIENCTITINFIVDVIKTLLDTTEKLFENTPALVHRDIKPENIMVDENGKIILMDLGVLKPVGVTTGTDVEKKQFVGTLKYAPPEFLLRTEENTKDGWQAINIYQIGAVLHDLIMKKELFEKVEPYTALIIAIKEDMPVIITSEYPPDLVNLARNMLCKDWRMRLKITSNLIIKNVLDNCLKPKDDQVNYYNEIKTKAQSIQNEILRLEDITRSKAEKEKIMRKTNEDILKIIFETFYNNNEIREMMKTINSSKVFCMDDYPDKTPIRRFQFFELIGRLEYGFIGSFYILFMVQNDSNNFAQICILGIIPNAILKENISNPERLMYEFFSPNKKYPMPHERITNPPELTYSPTCIFEGIVEFEDNILKELVNEKTAKLLSKITEEMKPDVQDELERRRKRLEMRQGVSVHFRIAPREVFINL
jgi:serine/threonine protein kinase